MRGIAGPIGMKRSPDTATAIVSAGRRGRRISFAASVSAADGRSPKRETYSAGKN